jgi:hypothetical protein
MRQSTRKFAKSPKSGGDFVQMALVDRNHQRLPPGIWVSIEKGLTRVRRIRMAVSKDAGLPMPPVLVHPIAWCSEGGLIYGRAAPIEFDDGNIEWGVELPAPTLLYVTNDDVLRQILCHEFAHCFWWIVEILRAQDGGKSEVKHVFEAAYGSQKQAQEDKEQLVDPKDWFGQWDVEHFMGDYDNPCLDAPIPVFVERWRDMGLPTIFPDSKLAVSRICRIQREHYSRARSLIQATAKNRQD